MLTTASYLTSRPEGETLSGTFMDVTQGLLDVSTDRTYQPLETKEVRPSDFGSTQFGSQFLDGYLKSAAWLTTVGITDEHMTRWLISFSPVFNA